MNQRYEIVIRECLTPEWETFFDGMEFTHLSNGSTCITGSLSDQSALYGLLMRMRDLGLNIISVSTVDPKEER